VPKTALQDESIFDVNTSAIVQTGAKKFAMCSATEPLIQAVERAHRERQR
jgi:hypothetical protein